MSNTDNDEQKKKKPASNREASKAKAGKKAKSDAKRKSSGSSAKAKGGKKSTEGDEKDGDQMSSDTASPRAAPMRYGPAPKATVSVKHLDSPHERQARGFSLGELSSSGISRSVAAEEMVMVDMRRRGVVDQNVEALKSWLKAAEQEESTS